MIKSFIKTFILSTITLFSVSALSAADGKFVQKSNLFPKVELKTSYGNIIIELDRSAHQSQ